MRRMSKVVNVIVSATHNSVIVVGHELDNVDGKRANGEPTDFFSAFHTMISINQIRRMQKIMDYATHSIPRTVTVYK